MGMFDDLIPSGQQTTSEPPTFIDRPAVQPSKKVWGDAEAQTAGVYEQKPSGLSFDDLIPQSKAQPRQGRAPVQITVNAKPVAERFGEMQQPASGASELQQGLEQRTLDMTRGEPLPTGSQMLISHGNEMAAASQRTSPDISRYGGKLISTQAQEDDAGNILYRDPQTKELKPTNNATQVVIRDPTDGVVKVFERSDATNESAFTGAARVASGAMLVGAPTARAGIASASKVVPRASDTFSAAKPLYRQFDTIAAQSVPMHPDQAKVMVDRLQNALDVAHLPTEVADQVHRTVALIGKKANGETALSQLQYVKRAVGNLFKSPDENVRNAAGVASKEIGRMIADESRVAAETLKKADAIHATARAQQDLQRKGDIANLRTGRAGYGGNAVNNMRTAVEKVVEASVNGRQTPYKPNEIQAMREISDGNWITNTARQVGAMSPSKGIIQIGTGIATGGTTAAVGAAANKLATVLTGKQLDRLKELVAKRSPAYEQAVSKAVARFEKSQVELMNDPAPNRLASYVSASRALSSGLTRDGIQVTSADLMRSLIGPVKSAADTEADQGSPVPGQ